MMSVYQMIKAGQIYKANFITKRIIALTGEDFNGNVHFIMPDGCVGFFHKTAIVQDIQDKFLKKIAEYPTWQEAVNSKEFKE